MAQETTSRAQVTSSQATRQSSAPKFCNHSSDQDLRDFNKAMERKSQNKAPKKRQDEKESQTQVNQCAQQQTLGMRMLAGMQGQLSGIEGKSINFEALAQHIERHFSEAIEEVCINISQFIDDTDVFISKGHIRFEASPESVALLKDYKDELERRFGSVEINQNEAHDGQPDQHQGSRNQYFAFDPDALEPIRR